MKTFLVLVFCLLVIDHGDSTLFGVDLGFVVGGFGLGLRLSLDMLPAYNNWIVIMQRFDGSVNFTRNWAEYRNGFGDTGGEFWIGNERIHRLTNGSRELYTLHIEVLTDGAWYYADYATFSLDSEGDKYAIKVSGYSGNAGDSLTNTAVRSDWYQGGMNFSTPDADNDKFPATNCALVYQTGWWFNGCGQSCLTCPYGDSFLWGSLSNLPSQGKLKAARIMIKRICA